MTMQETRKALLMLTTLYQSFKLDPNETEFAVSVWHNMLEEFPFADVAIAIKKLAMESPYPPTVHEIVKRISELHITSIQNEAEAYGEVMRAVRVYGMYKESEAMASLTPLTKKVVEQIGYKDICTSTNLETIRAQFRMAYQIQAEEIKKNNLLPEKFRKELEQGKQNLLGERKEVTQ
jgi:hypothetical protein